MLKTAEGILTLRRGIRLRSVPIEPEGPSHAVDAAVKTAN